MGQKVNPLGFRLGISQEHSTHWFTKSQYYSQLVVEDHFLRKNISERFANAGIAAIQIERQLDIIQIHIAAARPRQLLGAFSKDKDAYTGIQQLCDQLTRQLTVFRTQNLLKKQNFVNVKRNQKVTKDQTVSVNSSSNSEEIHSEHSSDLSQSSDSKYSESGPLIEVSNPSVQINIQLTKIAEPDTSAACLAEFIVEQLERRIPFRRALKQAIQRAEKASVKGIKVQISGRLNGAEIARSERIHKGQVPLHTLRAKIEYTSCTATTIYGLLGVKVWVFKGFV
uniref:ribosomal protein S3 n=1 Tax=Calidiella yingdensis TaxID=3031288 RepID=UPI002411029E|nr:ribosomal protein S3 [Calidiella yingdensis]WDY13042.1 ribosomal protein S3 [Calidiella yingdensis]